MSAGRRWRKSESNFNERKCVCVRVTLKSHIKASHVTRAHVSDDHVVDRTPLFAIRPTEGLSLRRRVHGHRKARLHRQMARHETQAREREGMM